MKSLEEPAPTAGLAGGASGVADTDAGRAGEAHERGGPGPGK
jgi:hypothetical protein